MKKQIAYLGHAVTTALLASTLCAEVSPDQFARMPLDQAKEIYDHRRTAGGGFSFNTTASDIVASVLKNQRIDLAKMIYDEGENSHQIYEQSEHIPDTPFKAALQVMILRDDAFWEPDPDKIVTPLNGLGNYTETMDIYTPICRKYLPGIRLVKNFFAWRVTRLQLADKLARAAGLEKHPDSIANAPLVPLPMLTVSPAKPGDLSPPLPGSTAKDQDVKSSASTPWPSSGEPRYRKLPSSDSVASPTSSSAVTPAHSHIPWIIGGGLVAVLLFLLARRMLRL